MQSDDRLLPFINFDATDEMLRVTDSLGPISTEDNSEILGDPRNQAPSTEVGGAGLAYPSMVYQSISENLKLGSGASFSHMDPWSSLMEPVDVYSPSDQQSPSLALTMTGTTGDEFGGSMFLASQAESTPSAGSIDSEILPEEIFNTRTECTFPQTNLLGGASDIFASLSNMTWNTALDWSSQADANQQHKVKQTCGTSVITNSKFYGSREALILTKS